MSADARRRIAVRVCVCGGYACVCGWVWVRGCAACLREGEQAQVDGVARAARQRVVADRRSSLVGGGGAARAQRAERRPVCRGEGAASGGAVQACQRCGCTAVRSACLEQRRRVCGAAAACAAAGAASAAAAGVAARGAARGARGGAAHAACGVSARMAAAAAAGARRRRTALPHNTRRIGRADAAQLTRAMRARRAHDHPSVVSPHAFS
jgi:hypothetical protein